MDIVDFKNDEDFKNFLKEHPVCQSISIKVGGILGLICAVENLYKKDKEIEALYLIDDYLKFPELDGYTDINEYLVTMIKRLKTLSNRPMKIKKINDEIIEFDPKGSEALVPCQSINDTFCI